MQVKVSTLNKPDRPMKLKVFRLDLADNFQEWFPVIQSCFSLEDPRRGLMKKKNFKIKKLNIDDSTLDFIYNQKNELLCTA